MTSATDIALSGLAAATLKLNAAASNLVNAGDVARVGGAPAYRPLAVNQSAVPGGGVVAAAVTLSPGQVIAFDPTSPLANAQGLVDAPEIDPVSEISNQLASSQAFAFSLKVLKAADENEQALLDIKA
jgi:flagellar basal-body rod protein FlgC